jgi:hypothetical protein
VGDVCSGAACAPGTNTCGCGSDADCAGQEDGNLCNGKLFCDKSALPNKCRVNPATLIACGTTLDGFCQQNQCKALKNCNRPARKNRSR